jgi:hypothetical protein
VYGDAQGGNFYVRQALDLGILKAGSPLEDCVMVGNKVSSTILDSNASL